MCSGLRRHGIPIADTDGSSSSPGITKTAQQLIGNPRTVARMKMAFEVGVDERHLVEFYFSKVWGGLSIKVDGVNIVRSIRFQSVSLVKKYNFTVGAGEQHFVTIEKHRERLFAGFRPQPVYAYVDGRLTAQGVA
jgi:hypothetical protein